MNRVDKYDHQGDCAIDEDTRPLCYCKIQLEIITTDIPTTDEQSTVEEKITDSPTTDELTDLTSVTRTTSSLSDEQHLHKS